MAHSLIAIQMKHFDWLQSHFIAIKKHFFATTVTVHIIFISFSTRITFDWISLLLFISIWTHTHTHTFRLMLFVFGFGRFLSAFDNRNKKIAFNQRLPRNSPGKSSERNFWILIFFVFFFEFSNVISRAGTDKKKSIGGKNCWQTKHGTITTRTR